MTTDNRTNEPTEAMVEAAAIAMHRDTGSRGGYGWTEYLSQARAALEAAARAAQGAAPQAERDWRLDVVPEPWTDPAPVLPSSGVDEDALESVRAERDAALARIAELEKMLENYTREYPIECNKRVKAEARIAKAAKLHRKYTYYELEDSCPDTTDEHREEHHHEASDDIGEFYCDQMPTGDVCCANCRDVNGDRMEWPCPTAVSLGLTAEQEGETE